MKQQSSCFERATIAVLGVLVAVAVTGCSTRTRITAPLDECQAVGRAPTLADMLPSGRAGDLLRAYFEASNAGTADEYAAALTGIRRSAVEISEALAATYDAAREADPIVQWNVIEATAALQHPAALRLLVQPLDEAPRRPSIEAEHAAEYYAYRRKIAVRLRALDGLSFLARSHPEATAALERALTFPDPAVKKMATFYLVQSAAGSAPRLAEIERKVGREDRWMMSARTEDIARSPALNAKPTPVEGSGEPAPRP